MIEYIKLIIARDYKPIYKADIKSKLNKDKIIYTIKFSFKELKNKVKINNLIGAGKGIKDDKFLIFKEKNEPSPELELELSLDLSEDDLSDDDLNEEDEDDNEDNISSIFEPSVDSENNNSNIESLLSKLDNLSEQSKNSDKI